MQTKPQEMIGNSAVGAEAAVVLLRNLIDYAGLFPPASLAMSPAVANYQAYSQSEFSWILGRFILPAARLEEFEDALVKLPPLPAEGQAHWGLSALLGADAAADLNRIEEFNARRAARHSLKAAKVKSVEVRITTSGEIERLSRIIPQELETYFEIPWLGATISNAMRPEASSDTVHDCISAICSYGRRAKIRTGGETAEKFPPPESVIDFIELCRTANVPFKATAGLHHPLRSRHRLTYQPDSPSGIMHGFLNVFLAAAFVRAGMGRTLTIELLREQSAGAFRFDSEGVEWRNRQLSVRDISASRQSFSISFGSCSFTEPVADLHSLHLL